MGKQWKFAGSHAQQINAKKIDGMAPDACLTYLGHAGERALRRYEMADSNGERVGRIGRLRYLTEIGKRVTMCCTWGFSALPCPLPAT